MKQQNKYIENTYIIYDGPSLIDGGPIVSILTLSTNNKKLVEKKKPFAQLWFLRKDVDPITASRLGLDESICGNCHLKGQADKNKKSGWAKNRPCYVILYMAPLNLFNNISNYEKISINEACKKIAGLKLRLGAYGDSGCIDQSIIDKLVKASKSHLGYTHQWNHKKASTNPAHTMASVETLDQKTAANKKGFRTFRVVNNVNKLLTLFTTLKVLNPFLLAAGFWSSVSTLAIV